MLSKEELQIMAGCDSNVFCSQCQLEMNGDIDCTGEAAKTALELFEQVEQLKTKLTDLQLHSMKLENGEVDLKVSGENARIFFATVAQVFKQNGGKNFLTVTMQNSSEKYAITIQNCNGVLTAAEKLEQLEKENIQLSEGLRLATLENEKIPVLCPYWDNPEQRKCFEWLKETLGEDCCPKTCPKHGGKR